jgi:hypothetical protein
MRFSIGDLIWLTVVVAMGVGWWIDHRRLSVSYDMWNEQITEAVKDTLRSMPFDPNTGKRNSDMDANNS